MKLGGPREATSGNCTPGELVVVKKPPKENLKSRTSGRDRDRRAKRITKVEILVWTKKGKKLKRQTVRGREFNLGPAPEGGYNAEVLYRFEGNKRRDTVFLTERSESEKCS